MMNDKCKYPGCSSYISYNNIACSWHRFDIISDIFPECLVTNYGYQDDTNKYTLPHFLKTNSRIFSKIYDSSEFIYVLIHIKIYYISMSMAYFTKNLIQNDRGFRIFKRHPCDGNIWIRSTKQFTDMPDLINFWSILDNISLPSDIINEITQCIIGQEI